MEYSNSTHIYLDNAASTPLDKAVYEAMIPYLYEYVGNPSSTHTHGRTLRTAIEQARRTIATLLGAAPSEIVFTSGGTEADNLALKGAIATNDISHVITSPVEHHAVTHTLEALEGQGKIKIHWLSVNNQGHIDLEELASLLEDYPQSLVSLMHGNNEIGTLHDIEAIAELCKSHSALLHSDTVQTLGNLTYDLSALPVDFMAASAHKFYGPKGIGFLYVRKGHTFSPLINGGGQERNLRAGTENVAAIVGMAKAFEKCYVEMASKTHHLQSLKDHMITQLQQNISGIAFNGDISHDHSLPTILNVAFPGDEGSMLTFHLDIAGISASGGSACNSGATMGSHVLTALGYNPRRVANSVRFSFGMQNQISEINYTIQKVKEIIQIPA